MFNLIILLSVLFSSSAQLFLKRGAGNLPEIEIQSLIDIFLLIKEILFNMYLMVGVIFQVIALLIWIFVLKKVDVSYAYPFISIGFVFVLFGGVFFFREGLDFQRIAGSIIICCGVILVSRSGYGL